MTEEDTFIRRPVIIAGERGVAGCTARQLDGFLERSMNNTMQEAEEATAINARLLPLQDMHAAHGATFIIVDGWTLPCDYGDARAEYAAVRDGGAGLFDLSSRGRIEVSGSEAVMFLNGMITNDVAALEAGTWMLAAFPNVQGRLVAFARILKLDAQTFLFDTEAATHHAMLKSLQRFTLAGDFHVKDLTEELLMLSLQGARAAEFVRAAFGDEAASVARGRIVTIENTDAVRYMIRATHTAEDGFDLFVSPDHAAALYDSLTKAGARPCGYEAFETLRIEAGIPRHGVDLTEQNVVLESGLDEAVSFTKGCYVGQEIIARIHWRGHVAKRLAGIVFDDAAPVEVGAQLVSVADNKEAARITSAVVAPALNRAIALALVRYAYLAPAIELETVSADATTPRRARVVELPFVRGSWYGEKEETP